MSTSQTAFPALTGLTGIAIGFLAMSMTRHHTTVFGAHDSGSRGSAFRIAGWFFMAASLLVAASTDDGGISVLSWFALLTAHAFAVTMLLTYAPRATPWWVRTNALGVIVIMMIRWASS